MQKRLYLVLGVCWLCACSDGGAGGTTSVQSPCESSTAGSYRYQAEADHLRVYNAGNCSYEALIIKGVNLGVATPGKYAGDLETAAGYNDFMRWFQLMVDAGINVVRV